MRKQILLFVSIFSLATVVVAQSKDKKPVDPPKTAAASAPAPASTPTPAPAKGTDSAVQIPTPEFQQGVAELQELQKLIVQEQNTIDVLTGRFNVLNDKLQKEVPPGFAYQNGLFVKQPPTPAPPEKEPDKKKP